MVRLFKEVCHVVRCAWWAWKLSSRDDAEDILASLNKRFPVVKEGE